MPRKPIYDRIPLDELGYPGGWAEVCINPSRTEMEAYADASIAVSPRPLPKEQLDELSGEELLKVLEANRPSEAALDAFMRSRMAVLGKVNLGDGCEWDLSTEDGYMAFGDEGDAQVTLLMQDEFARRRSERLKHAMDSFRSLNGKSPAAGQDRPEMESAA